MRGNTSRWGSAHTEETSGWSFTEQYTFNDTTEKCFLEYSVHGQSVCTKESLPAGGFLYIGILQPGAVCRSGTHACIVLLFSTARLGDGQQQ